MTVDEAIKYLEEIDQKYETEEDKNYYLVHGLSNVLKFIDDDDDEMLREKICERFSGGESKYLGFLDYVMLSSKKDIVSMKQEKHTSVKPKDHKEIHNIIDFYNEYDENLIRYIKGHLFIEYIMYTIIEKSLHKKTGEMSFYEKIKVLYKNNLINKKEKKLLISINKVRNDIAHVLDFKISFEKLFNLVKLSAECGVDYSDERIFDNKKISEEEYGIGGIIDELFPNLFCHLLYKNEKYFNDTEIYDYMA